MTRRSLLTALPSLTALPPLSESKVAMTEDGVCHVTGPIADIDPKAKLIAVYFDWRRKVFGFQPVVDRIPDGHVEELCPTINRSLAGFSCNLGGQGVWLPDSEASFPAWKENGMILWGPIPITTTFFDSLRQMA